MGAIYATVSIVFFPYPKGDSFLYLGTAAAIKHYGVAAGFDIYDFSFYPILLAWGSETFRINIIKTAQVFNALFFSGIFVALYLSAREITRSKSAALWAVLVFATCGKFFEYGSFYMRDPGYWLSLLISLYVSSLYIDQHRSRYIVCIAAVSFFGFLFRPEAFFYSSAILLYLFSLTPASHKRKFLVVIAIIVAIGCLLGLLLPTQMLEPWQKGLSVRWVNTGGHAIANFRKYENVFAKEVLGYYSAEFSAVGLVSAGITIVALKTLKLAGVAPCILLAFFLYKRVALSIHQQKKILLIIVLVVGIVAPLLRFLTTMATDYRYVAPAVLVIFIVTGRAIESYLRSLQHRHCPILASVIAILLLVGFAERFNPQKDYFLDLKHWLKSHPELSEFRFNDNQIGLMLGADIIPQNSIQEIDQSFERCNRTLLSGDNWIINTKHNASITACIRASEQRGEIRIMYQKKIDRNTAITVILPANG